MVDGAGNATVVWSYFNGADEVVQTAIREAGGSFTPPQQISESGAEAGFPAIDNDAAGNATAVWVRTNRHRPRRPGGLPASRRELLRTRLRSRTAAG